MRRVEPAKPRLPRVAFVVPRAGPGVAGGAEVLAQSLARELSGDLDIEILASRSVSLDWDNDLPPEGRLDGARGEVIVRRFVCRKVMPAATLGSVRNSVEDEYAFVGPDSPEFSQYLRDNHHRYDAIIAFGYAFNTTLMVSELAGKLPIIAHPCLHDEPQSQRWFYALVLRRFDHVVVQTPEEAHYLKRLFNLEPPQLTVLAPGVDFHQGKNTEDDAVAAAAKPYVLYAGRLDRGKNVDVLCRAFAAFFEAQSADAVGTRRPTLKVLGKVTKDFQIESYNGVEYLGYVSESAKAAYLREAICVINPSRYESLSLIVLEAWAAGTPVLVNAECEVLAGQVSRSGGGLSYLGFVSFCKQLRHLIDDPAEARRLGASGQQFVERNYCWTEELRERYRTIFRDVRIAHGARASTEDREPLDLIRVRSHLSVARVLAPHRFHS